MNLAVLLAALSASSIRGSIDREITGIVAHSNDVRPGALFVAIPGFAHDGHAFVPEAVTRGASAIVVERPVEVPPQVTRVQVPDSRLALALLSSVYYGHPSRELHLIGVTGTNGKGTTAYLIEAMFSRAGLPCGIIGTMGATLTGETVNLDRTTPEAPELQRLLRRMVEAGLRHAVMEVASHALALHRVAGCQFTAAVFTNLTQDHLDFHKTFEDYRAAKRRLFEMVSPDGVAVVNVDDPSAQVMAAATRARVFTYGIEGPADVRAQELRLHLGGADFVVLTPAGHRHVASHLHGRFNVYNALAAIAVAQSQGVVLDVMAAALAEFPGVPGRFEPIDEGQPFAVVVDYAHTPDGLENVLKTARDFVHGRTIVVFGCGGDRDRTKRPVMGQIASRLADVAIVTSDNPRSEQPEAIIEDIMAGIREQGTGNREQRPEARGPRSEARVEVEPDRRRAIARAIELAHPGDLVLIAGKGHESYQEVHGIKHPFDDRLVAREALRYYRASGLGPRRGHE